MIHEWQKNLWAALSGSGVKAGELQIVSSGRQAGKSHFTAQAIKRLMDDLNNRPVEELMLTEGKVHGARYYCIEPVGGSWPEMEEWAHKTYGKPGTVWPSEPVNYVESARWLMNNRKFWFRTEKDRDWFILRWRS